MTDHHHADNDGVSASGHRNEEAAIFLYDGEEDVPQDVTRVKLDASLRMIYAQIFFVHSHLSYVDLPEGLKSIRGRAFFMCEALSYIRFPSTLEEIESKKESKAMDCSHGQGLQQRSIRLGICHQAWIIARRSTATATAAADSANHHFETQAQRNSYH